MGKVVRSGHTLKLTRGLLTTTTYLGLQVLEHLVMVVVLQTRLEHSVDNVAHNAFVNLALLSKLPDHDVDLVLCESFVENANQRNFT